MEKLKVRQKKAFSIVSLLIAAALLISGLLTGKNILTDLGGALLIIPIYFVFDYILAVVRNQFKIRDEVISKMSSLEASIKKLETTSNKNKEQLERNLNVFFSIHSFLGQTDAPLPLMKGYAIDPEASLYLLNIISETGPDNVLDIGSGLSTLLAGYAVKKLNHGHVWSLEHDPGFYQISTDLIRRHKLEPYVTLIHAPLREYQLGEKTWSWYDVSVIPDNKAFDLVVVDGPPGTTQEMARYPALPLLKDRINKHTVILLDDADREDEKKIIERWKLEFQGLTAEMESSKKGLALLTF